MAPSYPSSMLPAKDAGQQGAVRACMDRLKPTFKHFQAKRLAFEIRDVGFTPSGNLDTLQQLVRWIFDRAVSDARYSSPCASLCFSLTPILPTFKPPGALTAAAKAKRIDFRQTLLNLCQREFEAALATSFMPQSSTSDTALHSSAASLPGSLQFLAHLYLHHLLTDRIMLSCLLMVAPGAANTTGPQSGGGDQQAGSDPGAANSGAAVRVDCLVRALLIAGQQLDECLAAQHRPLLDGLYDQLRAAQATSCTGSGGEAAGGAAAGGAEGSSSGAAALPLDLRTQLAQLLELRQSGWACDNGLAVQAASPAFFAAMSGRVVAGDGLSPSSAAAARGSTSPGGLQGGLIPKGADGVVTAAAVRPSKVLASGAGAGAAKSCRPGATAFASQGGSSLSVGGGAGTGPAAAAQPSPLPSLRRGLGSSSSLISRPSSQNLEGLWDLTPETYGEVRGQLLSQPIMDSPVTLEAMADELVEAAVAASGGAGSAGVFYLAQRQQPEAQEGSPGSQAPTDQAPSLSDEGWAAELQRQWDEQYRACEIYVRLCVDALQQMSIGAAAGMGAGTGGPSNSGPSSSGSHNGAAGAANGTRRASYNGAPAAVEPPGTPPTAEAPPANGEQEGAAAAGGEGKPQAAPAGVSAGLGGPAVSDAGRAFRRLLLLAAQSHFERCLATLMPPQPCPLQPQTPGAASPAAAPTTGEEGAASSPNGSGASSTQQQQQQRPWADQPAFAPDATSALPRARGMCHLLLGLLRHSVLTPRIVLHCAAALVDGAGGRSVPCLECACILLAGAGKQVHGFKVAEAAAFESLVKRVQALAVADAAEGEAASQGEAARVQCRRLVAWLSCSLRGH